MKIILLATSIALFAISQTPASPDGKQGPAQVPLNISVSVAPESVASGADAAVTVKLEPKPGIKLNKYPKIKLQVPAVDGLVAAAEQSMGNQGPPPAEQLDTNYFHGTVDPLKVTLHMDTQAAKGRHDVHAKLSYFYCVAASGYCAPGKADVTIPLTIR